jgi:aminopeptidase-like protein
MLARYVQKLRPRYSYRFLFIPGTIGSLTWLARNDEKVGRISHGIVLSCLGDAGGMTYKQSRRGNAAIDRISARMCCNTMRCPTASDLLSLMGMTSGSTVRPALICRSAV